MVYFLILISAVFVNNVVLAQFLGICPFEAITLENNLAYIDYTKCKACGKCAAECPVQAIVVTPFEN